MLGEIIEQDHDLNLIGKANNGEDMYRLIKEKGTGCSTTGSDHA